ncbi:hypothetical protein D3C84_792600 [compost metagenome]
MTGFSPSAAIWLLPEKNASLQRSGTGFSRFMFSTRPRIPSNTSTTINALPQVTASGWMTLRGRSRVTRSRRTRARVTRATVASQPSEIQMTG